MIESSNFLGMMCTFDIMIGGLLLVLWLHEALGQLQFFASPRTPFDLQKVVEVALSEVSPRPEVLITFATSLSTLHCPSKLYLSPLQTCT